jgi:hypothetical protein
MIPRGKSVRGWLGRELWYNDASFQLPVWSVTPQAGDGAVVGTVIMER